MKSIVLDDIRISNNQVDFYFSTSSSLQKYFNKNNHLFLHYNYNIMDIPKSILAIPFVANVIPLIWITNSTLHIDELDKSFYDCLNNIKLSYQSMFPTMEFKGEIHVKSLIDNSYIPEREAATLFSGGLDAITTFLRIKDKQPLLITEYGWHEDQVEKSKVWDADKENAEQTALKYGLENILIQSNYGNFIIAGNIDKDFSKKLKDSWWHGLHHGLAIISAAIPIAYKLKVNCIYIASSNTTSHTNPCASDPTVDNEIKYASGIVFHDGYELTRQDKVKYVVDHPLNEDFKIRVCFKNELNCCNCEKCLRTILAIVAEGKNPLGFGFNIPTNLSKHVQSFLYDNVKFFTPISIYYWELIQNRMKDNLHSIKDGESFKWFLIYDFTSERKKSLFKYRVTKFFPILKRKITDRLNRIHESIY